MQRYSAKWGERGDVSLAQAQFFLLLQPTSCCGSRPTNAITNMANYRVLSGMGPVIWDVGQPNQMLSRRPEEVTSGKNESGVLVGTQILLKNDSLKKCCVVFLLSTLYREAEGCLSCGHLCFWSSPEMIHRGSSSVSPNAFDRNEWKWKHGSTHKFAWPTAAIERPK